jgi:cobalamin biosynthesis protein CobD/CbiB
MDINSVQENDRDYPARESRRSQIQKQMEWVQRQMDREQERKKLYGAIVTTVGTAIIGAVAWPFVIWIVSHVTK